MTKAERSRLMREPVDETPAAPCCAEAQADGVPCDTVHAVCERCGRALAREAERETGPERPH